MAYILAAAELDGMMSPQAFRQVVTSNQRSLNISL
jgi:hypothetical protein